MDEGAFSGAQADNAINECRLMEIPIFGIVNTAVNNPNVLYPIPCNDASGSSFHMVMVRHSPYVVAVRWG